MNEEKWKKLYEFATNNGISEELVRKWKEEAENWAKENGLEEKDVYFKVRRRIKLSLMRVLDELEGVVVSDEVVDFSKFSNKKGYSRNMVIVDKEGKVHFVAGINMEVNPFPLITVPKKVRVKATKGKKERLWFLDNTSTIELGEDVDIKEVIKNSSELQRYIVPQLSDLYNPNIYEKIMKENNGFVVVKGNVLDIRMWDDERGVATIDDESIELDEKVVNAMGPLDIVEGSKDVIFTGRLYKKDGIVRINLGFAISSTNDRKPDVKKLEVDDFLESE